MQSRTRSSLLEGLENRLLCARTPAGIVPESLGRSFDITERQALFGRLTNLPAGTYKTLQHDLKASNVTQFDTDLLAYMRGRVSGKWYFDPSNAASIASYVKNNLGDTSQITRADAITDNRLFPEDSAATTYTVQETNAIDWNDGTKSTDPEFISALNRQDWWIDLAQGYRYTGDSKYLSELQYELASWSLQNPTFTLPAKVGNYTSYGFEVGLRVDSWMMAYFSVLGSSGWTGADNSLMLYKMVQQGDVLNTVAANTTDFTSNRSVVIGKALQELGEVIPEIDVGAKWQASGRQMVFTTIADQFYADGTHREQSPGYALNVLDTLLEDKQLDTVNGVTWSSDVSGTLTNAVNALWQQLTPDGKRPMLGDTYALNGAGEFTKATLALGDHQWPNSRADNSTAWEFGTAAVAPYLHDTTQTLNNRGTSASFPDSGNYVIRSDNGNTARQLQFTAGPKGGAHGHFDYMGINFWGYGRPLIADPGPYLYDTSAARAWVVSSDAHNTIAVPGVNPADIENSNDILVSGETTVAGGTLISATYQGYNFLPGQPTLSRSLWYDGNNTIVIVDFMSATAATNIQTGFTLEGQNTSRDLAAGTIYTKNASGGNVRIQSLLTTGQSAVAQTKGIFTSDSPTALTNPATRYNAQEAGSTFAVFATVITAYNGSAATATNNVSWSRIPTKAGQTAILNVNGQSITFSGPQFAQVGKNGQTRGTFNDIAYDSTGRLQMVFYDRDSNTLKYAIRGTNGVWGNIQTVDGQVNCGYTPSLAIDSNGLPHVAYQDAGNGDLRYAYIDKTTQSWVVQTVDVKGSTGAYPSLVLSRTGGAIIAYYNKTNGDLRLATSGSNGWNISTIDAGTMGGDVGRFPSVQLDPNRASASKVAVAYEDTTDGTFKYAIQQGTGYRIETLDGTTENAGGYISMKFYKAETDYEPVATYYDAAAGHLKYAVRDANGVWTNTVIASRKRQGLYSQLAIVNNTPRVFFYDGTNNDALFLSSTKITGGKWTGEVLGEGGRDIHYAEDSKGRFSYSTLNESTGFLNVFAA